GWHGCTLPKSAYSLRTSQTFAGCPRCYPKTNTDCRYGYSLTTTQQKQRTTDGSRSDPWTTFQNGYLPKPFQANRPYRTRYAMTTFCFRYGLLQLPTRCPALVFRLHEIA